MHLFVLLFTRKFGGLFELKLCKLQTILSSLTFQRSLLLSQRKIVI